MIVRLDRKLISSKITMAKDVHKALWGILKKKHQFDREKEHFYVLLLSRSQRIKCIDEVSIGNLHSTIVSAREVFRFAIHKGADTIIIAHNHPSGNMNPSQQDKDVTKSLSEAGELIGIKVLDSLIFCKDGYFSFAEAGLLS